MTVNTAAVAVTSRISDLATTRPAIKSTWYAPLREPPYQPPPRIFSGGSAALYADIAVSSAPTFDPLPHNRGEDRAYLDALGLNLVLTAGWSSLLLNRGNLAGAAPFPTALIASNAELTRRANALRDIRAGPLALHAIWCASVTLSFAHTWSLRRRRRIDVP